MPDEQARKERLSETLRELHAQLADVDAMDLEMRAELQGTLEEIQEALETDEPPRLESPKQESILQRLGEAARHFEETHPALAGTVGSVIEALGRMGI